MSCQSIKHVLMVALVAAAVTLGGSPALASPIGAGYDLFETLPFDFNLDLGFFGSVMVRLQGNPDLLISQGISLGSTDTIVQRLGGIDILPVGGVGVVDIELVALSLTSVEPVQALGNTFNVDVIAGRLLAPIASSAGQMTVRHAFEGGGTFSAILPVSPLVILTDVNDLSNSLTILAPQEEFGPDEGIWSHRPVSQDQHNDQFPAGGFFAAVDPVSGLPVVHQTGPHPVRPSAPEPSTLALSGIGGLVMIAYRWRRRKQAA